MPAGSYIQGTICKYENRMLKVARGAFNIGEVWNPVCCHGNKSFKLILCCTFKVSARVKKGEFSKFLILRHSDKAFQELSFKKNSTKKYSFSAKLLDVEVYFTLIVLITR